MSETEGERRWSEGPRVRVRTRVVRRGDAAIRPVGAIEPASGALRSSLRTAEHRFLSLQTRSAEGASPETLLEYLSILADLRVVGNRLQEVSGRRDISYLADRQLTVLYHHCLWLTQRVSAEFLLLLQIQLEQELKRMIGPQAYQVYLRLEDVGDAAREVEMLDDRDLMGRLREGTLLREILDQVFLQSEFASSPHTPATAATGEGGAQGDW